MAQMLKDRMASRVIGFGIAIMIALVVSFWGAMIYVAWHFISKYW